MEESGEAEQVMGETYPFLLLSNDNFEEGSTRHSQKISSATPSILSFLRWCNYNISVVGEASVCFGIQRKICIFHLIKGQMTEGSPGYVLACQGTFFSPAVPHFFAIETGV